MIPEPVRQTPAKTRTPRVFSRHRSVCPVLRLHVDVVAARQDLGLGHVPIARARTRRDRHYLAVLVDKLKVVAAEQVGDGGQLGAVSLRVFVELEERHREELHVLRDAENLYKMRRSALDLC